MRVYRTIGPLFFCVFLGMLVKNCQHMGQYNIVSVIQNSAGVSVYRTTPCGVMI